ncbi:uncharacterized protein PAC_18300 [Phialocephala subalpina]|uniref:Uncharacterized protein n=1 Tax=Phialocephala subalpina TaxID=576137 RepID=A0A1L7XTN3_9HELO|nr:uncharacterized protein PAC_18300 [Phialocephala subalpina]
MLKDNNLARQLKACEIMGNVTNICSDKTGTVVELDDMHRLYVKGASERGSSPAMRHIHFELLAWCIAILSNGHRPGPRSWKMARSSSRTSSKILSSLASLAFVTHFVKVLKRQCRPIARQARLCAWVTGDNILTAKAIAKECSILSSTPSAMAANGDIAMEGSAFRALSTEERDRIIPHLKVLARSSPDDNRILVARLKELGEIVAVTGDRTNDAPTLAAADTGLSMGISGTEVAREASSIVLMDDNFSSIVKAIMWCRAVNDAVKKFLQFQITVSITSVMLTFVSARTTDRPTTLWPSNKG